MNRNLVILGTTATCIALTATAAIAQAQQPKHTHKSEKSATVGAVGVPPHVLTLSGNKTFPEGGISIATPPAALLATTYVTAATALAAAGREGPISLASAPADTVEVLAEYTNLTRGTKQADGTIAPLYRNRLVWIIEIPNVPVSYRGPFSGVSYPKQTAALWEFVDASSGQVLESLQDAEFGS
jgi:hypothetical protein